MKNLTLSIRRAVGRFLRQSKGAIVIEAAFTLVAFVTVIALVIDLGIAFVQQSRLERATYTAASVLRERVALYDEKMVGNRNRPISQAEVNQLQKIVGQLMGQNNLVVIVDEMQFDDTNKTAAVPMTGFPNRLVAANPSGSTNCKSVLPPMTRYNDMSPWSSRKRWLPLYRVTVCIPGTNSWFKRMVNSSGGTPELTVEELIAFNIVIPR